MEENKDGIVIIYDKLRVQVSSDCLTLQSYQGLNKDKKEIWKPKGYYTSWVSLFNGVIKEKLDKRMKNKILSIEEFVKEFKELRKEIQKTLKEFM
jgi:hypothetical protein